MLGCLRYYFTLLRRIELLLCRPVAERLFNYFSLFFYNKNGLIAYILYLCSMKGEANILEVSRMTVSYGSRTVINDFSMFLNRGEMVAVTGASGSGKSSLLRAILGFVLMDSGEVNIDGTVVGGGHYDVLRQRTSYLPQDLSFPCEFVSEVLELPFTFKCNRHRGVSHEMWDDYLLRLGLDKGIKDMRVNEISGGQRQRLMLAVTAMLDKDIILLDEPTSALDSRSAELVIDFLQELVRNGKSVLAVTHDAKFAAACDRIVEIPTL